MNIVKGGYNDRTCEGNSAKHHTGKICIEPGCNNPAGTAWSPYWCVDCNIERINLVTKQMEDLLNNMRKTTAERSHES